eukprot:GHVU01084330.1.p1 GENE.GHVU01084330.1~~GHVU01084330.1.p1  ORF type:complete len:105 (+),score=4.95 GHVU01084330.1:1872-2186(+)
MMRLTRCTLHHPLIADEGIIELPRIRGENSKLLQTVKELLQACQSEYFETTRRARQTVTAETEPRLARRQLARHTSASSVMMHTNVMWKHTHYGYHCTLEQPRT